MPHKVKRRSFPFGAGYSSGAKTTSDWWSRASVVSGFLSSVVIGAVGLAITSSIQKAQIESSKSVANAQIEIEKLKNADDRRLEENKLANDLLQNLLSDEPRHRQFAIIMLRRTVEPQMYDEILAGIASNDPAENVRKAALQNLASSQSPSIAATLNRIASDSSRPEEERKLADLAKTKVTIEGSLSDGACLFIASSAGTRAYTSLNGGIFTQALVSGIRGAANDLSGKLTLQSLREYLSQQVPILAMREIGQVQHPSVACSGFGLDDVPLFTRPTNALAVAITEYANPHLASIESSERDVNEFSNVMKSRGTIDVSVLTGKQATRQAILEGIEQLSRKCGPGTDCIVFFSGHGVSIGDKGYLLPYDGLFSENPTLMDASSVSIQDLMPMLRSRAATGSRVILFFDSDTSPITDK